MIDFRKIVKVACLLGASFSGLWAQADPVLFTVQNKEVRLSEFKYIYDKNNGNKANYSDKTLREYLQLYTDFKLQILKGEDMKLDQNENIKREQAQYRAQLANNYLTDREITEKLVKEAYERSKEDRKVAHIYLSLREGASDAEVKEAYDKLKKVKDMTTAANFADMAAQHSEDGFSKSKGGDLGYFTALGGQPYEFENAIYQLNKGQISEVTRTPYGFHIFMLTDIRPAYGTVQVSQILIRNSNPAAKTLIDSLSGVLKNGGNFEALVIGYSEDNASKSKAGSLGWVRLNQYSETFEKAAFSLKRDGEISAPFESSAGWHMLKRVKAQTNPTYMEVKNELTDRVKRDARFELVQAALVERIQKEANYSRDEKIYTELLEIWRKDATVFNTAWTPDAKLSSDERTLFSIGGQNTSVRDFITTAVRLVPERVNLNPRTPEASLNRVFQKAVAQKALAYEETQLDKKYPEFKSLLREYEEGILLFEVKKQLIWDKASADTTGLKAFFEANSKKYLSREQAVVTLYTVNSAEKKEVSKIVKMSKNAKAEDVKAAFNAEKALVSSKPATYEKGKEAAVDKMKWKVGSVSKPFKSLDGKTTSFYKIEQLIPERFKSLDEARGYVVADYQDSLEKGLLKQLREQYAVKVDEAVFKTLVKK